MVPEHNDERWLNDDLQLAEDDAAEPGSSVQLKDGKRGRKAGRRSSSSAKAGSSAAAGVAAAGGQGCYTVSGAGIKDLQQWAADLVAQQQQQQQPGAFTTKGLTKLPLQLAPNLQLLKLGRVEFLHPRFHSEKFIWPVGFTVRRRARTPASGGKELWHLAEVLEHPDGSGPLFR